MNRRQLLKSITLSTGVVIAAGTFSGLLQAATKTANADWLPVFLNREEAFAVTQIADAIIPASEIPGAVDVAVPQFIDLLLKDVFSIPEREKFRQGLQVFLKQYAHQYGAAFHKSSVQLQRQFIEKNYTLSPESTINVLELVAEIDAPRGRENEYFLSSFLVTQRELTIKSYFTSEKIAKQVLSYDPIPGRYDPCMPVSEVGNVWTF
ncbi:gluconate 2-dehydrogenase subunit 3 family protein [Pseudomaricurvus alcaniphilus]|uniref:gluconate 2-dehydrogenase subunit 3 family protein n=1 Tax=Pseudomaricurvus alcaniphilus TaxID=1166482 RepID=UPI00140AAE78|nr:gluconate 2-dehydrogenase subunit 3 family protein [Pseudomaricurvus alcaniphilus]NHN37353.1 gluconate 2-dehydrogenase subunit 3 family protein [Pseudomaricurvus alcaniphilus]